MTVLGLVPGAVEHRDALLPVPMTIQKLRHETPDTFTIDLDAAAHGGFGFAPGQFNMLYLFGTGEAAISISGNPLRPGTLRHTIRAVGAVTRGLGALRKGDSIGVRGPFGRPWPLAAAEGKDVVIVAGGIGIAPLRSVVYTLLQRRKSYGKLSIAYGARTPADIVYRSELEKWRGRIDVELEVSVDRGDPDWRGNTGVVTKFLPRFDFDPANSVAMICGPEVMMRYAARDLIRLGMPGANVYLTMERNMTCAVGSCGHCQLGPAFVCRDGPVYAYSEIGGLMAVREL